MVYPLRRAPVQPAVPTPITTPTTRRYLLVVAVCSAFGFGTFLPPVAYWAGYEAGQRAADEDAVYRAVGEAVRMGVRVGALADTVEQLRRSMVRQAVKRLPQRVVDSLRAVRWGTP